MTTKQAIATLSADAAVLIAHISQKSKGDLVTYDEIATTIGWDIRRNRGIMVTVKNRLLRDYSIVLSVVMGVGYKVLDDGEIVTGELSGDRERRRKSAVRSKRKAESVTLSNLAQPEQLRCLAEITAAHVTIEASGDKSVKQIASNLNGNAQPLALNKALEALKHNIK